MLRIGCGIDFVGATRPPPVSCRDRWAESIYASLSQLESKKCESLSKHAVKMDKLQLHFHAFWFFSLDSTFQKMILLLHGNHSYETPWDVSLVKTCMSTTAVRKSMSTHPWPFICSTFLGWVGRNGSSFPLWWITCLNVWDRQQTRSEWDWSKKRLRRKWS